MHSTHKPPAAGFAHCDFRNRANPQRCTHNILPRPRRAPSVCTAPPMQPEVRVDSCTSRGAAPERILAPCAGQGLTFNLHEASRCTQPWLQPMHQCTSTPSIPVVRLITSGDIQYQAIYTVVCIRCISGVISADMSYQQRLLLRNDWAVAAEIGQTTSLRGSVSAFIPPLSPCRRPLNYLRV